MTARPGDRAALIIATSRYQDTSFPQLQAPRHDASNLAAVLGDSEIGGFDVESYLDPDMREMRVVLQRFLSGRLPPDTVVVYLSGHGECDERGRLHFIATDTRRSQLAATGVEALWLIGLLQECRARSQIVILDCCSGGAFATGAKGSHGVQWRGRGRIVLTAARAGENAYEEHAPRGIPIPESLFTAGLVEGLRGGGADFDGDGLISVDDAFDFACEFVRAHGCRQSPQRWVFEAEDHILLARSAGRAVTVEHRVDGAGQPAPIPTASVAVAARDFTPARRTRAGTTVTAAPARPGSRRGLVVAWGGRHTSAVLAMKTTVQFGYMTVPAGMIDIVAIAAGERHALALSADGTIHAWGEPTFGRTRVPRRLAPAVAVAAGGSHCLALTPDGRVVGWGNSRGGQTRAPQQRGDAVAIAAGGWHSLALRADGTVSAWGDNRFGQATVPRIAGRVVAVAAGARHSLALCEDGRVIGWGDNRAGQVPSSGEAHGLVQIAAGGDHSAGIHHDGTVMVWGCGDHDLRLRPALGCPCTGLSISADHGLALVNGRVVAWGRNDYEQCDVPADLDDVIAVAAGHLFSVAIVATTRADCAS